MAKGKVEYWLTSEGLTLLGGWAREGLTDEQIAHNMNISVATLYNYKNKHLEILEVLKKNKEIVDYEVENALHQKALGYNIKVLKNIKVKRIEYDNQTGFKKREYEEIIEVYDEVHVPADTTAQIYWLNNRKPEQWRNKQDKNNNDSLSKLDKLLEEQKNA